MTITKTVKPSGGDYTSLSAYEAGEQADLVTLDQIRQAECYAMADTALVVIDGWTTDATRYLRVYTPSTERHAGVWNTSKYRLDVSRSSDGHLLQVEENFVRVEGIQLRGTLTASGLGFVVGIGSVSSSSAGEWRIASCLVACVRGGFNVDYLSGIEFLEASASAVLKVWNTILYDWIGAINLSRAVAYPTGTSGKCYAYNVTAYTCGIGFSNEVGAGVTFLAKNCGASACTTAFSTNVTQTTCSSSTPTFVNAASRNLHLAATDTTWLALGTNLSADATLAFSDDIDGQTRSGTWDIGADQHAVVSVSGTGGSGLTEAEVVAGGKTIILTLTGDIWIAN